MSAKEDWNGKINLVTIQWYGCQNMREDPS